MRVYEDVKEGYQAIERELEKRREQAASVKSNECPFRVEFRYRRGTRHYQYFKTYEDTLHAEDSSCRYSPFGSAIIERPSSRVVQVKGPRGGWKRYKV